MQAMGQFYETIYISEMKPTALLGTTILDAVINKFNSFKSQEIVEYMHEEIAYKKTNDKEIIPFSLARQIKDF